MNKHWDYEVPKVELWKECLRVLKPGGHLLSFAGTRTYHRMTVNIEDAGFEIRDMISWIYGSGFPKSLDIGKAIDKIKGAQREVIGKYKRPDGTDRPNRENWSKLKGEWGNNSGFDPTKDNLTNPATPEAIQYNGYGTALKPACEPICVARKPIPTTVAENVLKYGTGGINIDATRIEIEDKSDEYHRKNTTQSDNIFTGKKPINRNSHTQGRFPANIIFDEIAGVMLDEMSGELKSGVFKQGQQTKESHNNCMSGKNYARIHEARESSTGGASRFFYCAKSSRGERNNGLDCYLTVKYITDKKQCKEENTVAVQLLKRVMSDTVQVSFNTVENGVSIMGLCHRECLSIILTEINRIIELKTLNSLTPLLTKESTPAVKSEKANGGNPAESAESLKRWLLTITNGNLELARGANRVALKMLSLIKENENWQDLSNFHSTVKPLKLMQYLVRLVTPKGGVCLDPFTGSGTTLMACVMEGFDYIGIEREKEYCDIAEARVKWAKGQKTIEDKERDSQTNLFI
jgi:site-specific DNA-methyltransferase (adenine-specific)